MVSLDESGTDELWLSSWCLVAGWRTMEGVYSAPCLP